MFFKYKSDLVDFYDEGYKVDYIFFCSHKPEDPGVVGKECLSQWYPSSFKYAGITFPTAEHFMMYQKAMAFDDMETAEKILVATDPKEVKSLGRQVKNYNEDKWSYLRYNIVYKGNVAKFEQNHLLMNYLVNGTKGKVLVEAAHYDTVWGIGMRETDEGVEDPRNWFGLNLLGFALMEVRSTI